MLARPIVADVRPRQALVGDHAVLDQMAEVDEPFRFHIRHKRHCSDHQPDHVERSPTASAPCHQPLTTKPGAAGHVHPLDRASDRPVSRPIDSSR